MIKHITFLRDFDPFSAGEAFDLRPITVLVGDQGAGKSTMLDVIVKYEKPKLAEVNARYMGQDNQIVRARGNYMEEQAETAKLRRVIDMSYVDELSICYVDTEKHNPRMTRGDTTLEYKNALVETLRDEALLIMAKTMGGFEHASNDDKIKLGISIMTERLMENLGKYFDSKRGGSILGDEIKMDVTASLIAIMQSHGQSIFPLLHSSTDGKRNCSILLDEPETALSLKSQNKVVSMLRNLARHNQLIVATHSPIIMDIAVEVLSLEHKRWMSKEEFLETQRANYVENER